MPAKKIRCLEKDNNAIDESRKEDKKINSLPVNQGSVGTFYVRALLDYLDRAGVDPTLIFDDALLAEVNATGARITQVQWQSMMEAAIAYTHDPNLPLRVGSSVQPKHLGIFGFAAMSGQRLSDVVEMLLHYEPLIVDANSVRLVENGDFIELHRVANLTSLSPVMLQQSLACWVNIARQLIARPEVTCDAYFAFTAPADTTLYQQIFGGRVCFDAPTTKIVFPKSFLAEPLAQHDPTTHSLLMLQVEKNLQSLKQSSFLQKIREHLAAHLSSNQLTINDVASAFEMSPRTLQYQLAAEGFSFRNLLETVRQEHAEYHLKHSNIGLCEIAALLGYSEQSPFQNAFKRWTGMSPGEYRRTQQQAKRA